MAENQVLLRAMVELVRLSVEFTHAAADHLGDGNTGNRQIQILTALNEHPGMVPSCLAELLDMSRSSVSHALSRFEEQRLISRLVDNRDRRSVRLGLTPRGQARVRAFEAELERILVRRAPELGALLEHLDRHGRSRSDVTMPVRAAVKQLTNVGVDYVADVLPALRPYGVTETSDRFALTLLLDGGVLRPAQLAAELRMSSSGTCTLLDRLVAGGLVERGRRSEVGDRRAVPVSLTARGREAAELGVAILGERRAELSASLAACLGAIGGVTVG